MLLELIYERSRHKSRPFFFLRRLEKEKKLSGRAGKNNFISQQQISIMKNGKNSMSLSPNK